MKRDVPLDVVRGLCIVSMVVAHLASGSFLSRMINVSTLVDGASGFFLLSGLVLGIVYERRSSQMTTRSMQHKIVRRAGLIFAVHGLLLLLAVGVGSQVRGPEWADPAVVGGWIATLIGTVTLTLNPPMFGILSVYVPLMLMAAIVVPMLAAGRYGLAATSVVATYGASMVWPSVFTLPEAPGVPGFWNWGGWQALFFAGLFAGWFWRRLGLRERSLAPRGLLVSVGVVAGGMLLWRLLASDPVQPFLLGMDGEELRWALFNKGAMAPLRLVMALAAIAVLYAVVTTVHERGWLRGPVAVIARIGRKSLDSFVISRLALIALSVVFTYESGTWFGALTAVLTLAAGWLWAKWREDLGGAGPGLRQKVFGLRGAPSAG